MERETRVSKMEICVWKHLSPFRMQIVMSECIHIIRVHIVLDNCSPCLCIFSNHNDSLLLFPHPCEWFQLSSHAYLLKKSRKKKKRDCNCNSYTSLFSWVRKRAAEASRNKNEVNSNGFPLLHPLSWMVKSSLSLFFLCFPLPFPLTLRINQYFSCVSRVDNKYNRTNRHNIPSRRSLSTSLQNRTGLEWLAPNLVMYTLLLWLWMVRMRWLFEFETLERDKCTSVSGLRLH